jgi:hypothetical protein
MCRDCQILCMGLILPNIVHGADTAKFCACDEASRHCACAKTARYCVWAETARYCSFADTVRYGDCAEAVRYCSFADIARYFACAEPARYCACAETVRYFTCVKTTHIKLVLQLLNVTRLRVSVPGQGRHPSLYIFQTGSGIHLSPTSVKVNNAWRCTSTLQCIFMN